MVDLGIIASIGVTAIVMVATSVFQNYIRRKRRRKIREELEIRRAAIRLAYSLSDPNIDCHQVYSELYAFGRSIHDDGYSVATSKQQMKMLLANALSGRSEAGHHRHQVVEP